MQILLVLGVILVLSQKRESKYPRSPFPPNPYYQGTGGIGANPMGTAYQPQPNQPQQPVWGAALGQMFAQIGGALRSALGSETGTQSQYAATPQSAPRDPYAGMSTYEYQKFTTNPYDGTFQASPAGSPSSKTEPFSISV